MQIRISFTGTDTEWQIKIRWTAAGEEHCETRSLGRAGVGSRVFPIPPEEERVLLPQNTPQDAQIFALCNDISGQPHADAFADLNDRVSGNGLVRQIGRYLFLTLFGPTLWQRILADLRPVPGENQPISLLFEWSGKEALDRLPWEMICGPSGPSPQQAASDFIAKLPELAFIRCIPPTSGVVVAPPTNLSPISAPPRILFIVGSELETDGLRPGAEYLNLLRSLRAANQALAIKSFLLLKASAAKIIDTVRTFRPDVVHFICHGSRNAALGQSGLKLRSDDGKTEQWHSAESLLAILALPNGVLPQVAVLSACFSGASGTGAAQNSAEAAPPTHSVNAPLAMQLVRGGIPLVVGMGGAIADQACRLFTSTIYRSLLDGEEIGIAVARGRRAGILGRGGETADESPDWALPMLFADARAAADLRVVLTTDPRHTAWMTAAGSITAMYGKDNGYPVFCDRIGVFEQYDQLMAAPHTGNPQTHPVIAVRASDPKIDETYKFGASWLLYSLTVHAIRDGHVPVSLIREADDDTDEWPKTTPRLFFDLNKVLQNAQRVLGLMADAAAGELPASYFDVVRRQTRGAAYLFTPALPCNTATTAALSELETAYNSYQDPDQPEVLSAAFRLDLLELLRRARDRWPDQGTKRILLLIDDVHGMGEAAKTLLFYLFGTNNNQSGLMAAYEDIRVIFTYDQTNDAVNGATYNNYIKKWLESTAWKESAQLGAFGSDKEQVTTEARMAYEYFLLHWQQEEIPRPLAIRPNAPAERVSKLFSVLHKKVQGIPSLLETQGQVAIDILFDFDPDIFVPANDEQAVTFEANNR